MISTHARLGAEISLDVLENHLITLTCDLFGRDSKASSLLGKAGFFACPGNHHLETGAVTLEMALEMLTQWHPRLGWVQGPHYPLSCDVCLETLPLGTQVLFLAGHVTGMALARLPCWGAKLERTAKLSSLDSGEEGGDSDSEWS